MRVVLPSNASLQSFPNNSLASYTVKLPYPINLSSKGSWEVALAEIQFQKSWFNVRNASITISLGTTSTDISINEGYYETNESLIQHLNSSIKCAATKQIAEMFVFKYNKITRTCSLHINVPEGVANFTFKLSNSLKDILKISDNMADIDLDINECSTNPDSTANQSTYVINGSEVMKLKSIYTIMVYCDLAEPSIVGDIESPLLRTIPVEEGHWKYQCTSPSKLQYLPVSQREIRTISVYIFSDFGEMVPFTTGRTIVTLELRKVKQFHIY